MKRLFGIFIISLLSVNVFATDYEPQLDGTNLHKIYGFYAAVIDEIDLSKIDIRNKVIYFVTNDPHEFDGFAYRFNSIFAKEIIARDWFRRQDFQTEELYNICRELRERGGNSHSVGGWNYSITVVANDRYGFFIRFMDGQSIARHFFEINIQ